MDVIRTVDSDGHVMEPDDLWARYLSSGQRHRVTTDGARRFRVDGKLVQPRKPFEGAETAVRSDARFEAAAQRDFDARSQLASMDVEGIDLAVLFPSAGLVLMGAADLAPDLGAEIARAYNDWLHEFCSDGDGRLFGAGMLDLRDPARAAAEARRCVGELGFVAMFSRPNPVEGRQLYDTAYEQVWSTLEELDVPICFHEGSVVGLPQVATDRFDRHALWHPCTHPMEQQMAMVAMVLGGVLHRHPGLRAAFLECGAGWLPYWMWRMDEAWEADGARETPELDKEPSAYVRAQCFVSIDSDEGPGISTLEALDDGNVVWGSDYPHPDSKFPQALKTVSSLPGMTAARRTAILTTNPGKVYTRLPTTTSEAP